MAPPRTRRLLSSKCQHLYVRRPADWHIQQLKHYSFFPADQITNSNGPSKKYIMFHKSYFIYISSWYNRNCLQNLSKSISHFIHLISVAEKRVRPSKIWTILNTCMYEIYLQLFYTPKKKEPKSASLQNLSVTRFTPFLKEKTSPSRFHIHINYIPTKTSTTLLYSELQKLYFWPSLFRYCATNRKHNTTVDCNAYPILR